jgi:hypothetical protein
MKPTLTAADPAGWWLCNHRSPARVVDLPLKWSGRDLLDAFGISYDIREFTNFRPLVSQPAPERIVGDVLALQATMTDEQRMEFWSQLQGDYCTECGCNDPRCQCWNDE